MKKICVVTGTRAEYGLLYWLLRGVEEHDELELQLIVTGMHLSPEFGLTWKQIVNDGFKIDKKVEMLLSSDTPSGISKSTGLAIIGFADAFEELKPDVVVVLGDRFEILAAAFSATVARIPIAHLHGGETTQGAIDEAIRHAITKMSLYHFTANREYQNRVIQLGEDPRRVLNVGGLGIDNIKKLPLLSKTEFEAAIGFTLNRKNLMVTFHPVTLENSTAAAQFQALLDAFTELEETHLIFTLPNADTDGRILIQMVEEFVQNHKEIAVAFTSLGQLRYLSAMKYIDGVIGNSSSGLIEAPSFKIGSINIGDRQTGRMKAKSIIDCEPTKDSILNALKTLYSTEFQSSLKEVENPYGDGGAAQKILHVLEKERFEGNLKKRFFDFPTDLIQSAIGERFNP